MLGKTSSSAQLPGAFPPHCGSVSTSQAAPGDRKTWEMWLQGMGEWQIWVCRNGRVPDCCSRDGKVLRTWQQGQKSSRTVTAGMVEP